MNRINAADGREIGKILKGDKHSAARFFRNCPTKAEQTLWDCIRQDGFQEQVVLYGYVVDFYHPTVHLAVEVDGSAHGDRVAYDRQRDLHLWKRGIGVLRFQIGKSCRRSARRLGRSGWPSRSFARRH